MLGLLDDGVDAVRSRNQVFARPLDDVKRDHRIAKLPRITLLLFLHEPHFRHVSQVNRRTAFRFDDDVLDFFGRREIAHHLHGPAGVVHEQIPSRNRHVFLGNRSRNVIEAHLHRLRPQVVDNDFHLLVHHTADVHLADFRQLLNFILEVFRITLEVFEAVIAAEVDIHHRKQLAEIQLKDVGVRGQVVRKIGVGLDLVHGVFDLPKGFGRLDREIELDVHRAVALNRSRGDFIDTRDGVDFLFERPRDQLFDVDRAVAGIRCADVNLRNDDIRETLLGHCQVAVNSAERDDCNQDEHCGSVLDAPGRQPEFTQFALQAAGFFLLHRALLLEDSNGFAGGDT